MITISRWPAALGPPDRPLDPTKRDAFAAFCADLVRALNVEQRLGVAYFEIGNELDEVYANAGAELGKLVRAAAIAMKAIESNVKVGGPGFIQAYRPEIPAFLAEAADAIDFVSYHGYGTGDPNAAIDAVLATARGFGDDAAAVRSQVRAASSRAIEVLQTQWSLDWRADARMIDARGAAFDALAMQAFAASAADGTTGWNDSDGWYGKLDGSFVARPGAAVLGLYNRFMTGAVVRVSGADAAQVDVMAVVDGARKALSIVNAHDAGAGVDIALTGGSFAAAARVYQSAGTAAMDLGAPRVQGGRLRLTLPAWSVTVVADPAP
jgi:xylan 1,4-beta-xylosidase